MTLDELKKKLAANTKWRKEHPVQTAVINFYEFFRYVIPRTLDDWKYAVIYAKDRMFRGYDDRMVFSYHYENTQVAIKVLTWLRKHRNGSPMTCKHAHLKCKCDPHESWNKILDQMIAGFKAQNQMEDMYLKKYSKEKAQSEMKRLQKVWETGMKAYTKHYSGLWD